MSDYFLTHETKQRINDLHHLRADLRQADSFTDDSERTRRLKVTPVRFVQVIRVMLNAIAHVKIVSHAAPAYHHHAIPERTPLAVERAQRP